MPKAKRTGNAKGSANALNARINAIRKDINPMIRVMGAKGNPKPLNKNKTVYVTRTYPIEKTSASNTAAVSVNDVLTCIAADPQVIADARISMVKVWNTTVGSSLLATLYPAAVMDSGSAAANVQGVDYGTSSSLAGIKFDVPDTLSTDLTSLVGTSNVLTATTGGVTDKILVHVTVRFTV